MIEEISDLKNPPFRHATYLGDGVYTATVDGNIILATPRSEGVHWMVLSDLELKQFLSFLDSICPKCGGKIDAIDRMCPDCKTIYLTKRQNTP